MCDPDAYFVMKDAYNRFVKHGWERVDAKVERRTLPERPLDQTTICIDEVGDEWNAVVTFLGIDSKQSFDSLEKAKDWAWQDFVCRLLQEVVPCSAQVDYY